MPPKECCSREVVECLLHLGYTLMVEISHLADVGFRQGLEVLDHGWFLCE